MARIRVAVVYGGRSSEHGISVVSAGSVLRALDPEKYEVVPVGITPSGGWTLTASDPEAMQISGGVVPEVSGGTAVALPADPAARHLVPLEPGAAVEALAAVDVVFPLLHGRFGEDGTIQGLLDLAGIPYVGSGVFASAAAMDKEFAKKLLQAEGLRVGEYAVVREGQRVSQPALAHLGLPAFVKPARAGSSVGITKITDWAQLPDALELAFEHDSKALVESAIVGREIECGVLENADGEPEASVPAEIRVVRGGHDWYDYEAKYLEDACEFDIPADLPPDVTAAVQRDARRAFVALDCAGLARVDFFVTADGPVINEVNTMPGFTSISLFPQVWAASGVDYPALIDRLIAAALRRGPAR